MLEERFAGTTLRFSEFMDRTDGKLNALIETTDNLQAQSNEWAGVRKTLAAIAATLTLVGGLVGYLFHYFWPPPSGH